MVTEIVSEGMPARFRPDVLCIGESMIMVASPDASPLEVGTSLVLAVGGAESNVAVGLAAAGKSVAWASLLGTGALGDLIERHLADSGIDTRLVERRTAPTGLYLKSAEQGSTVPLYYRAGSAASLMDGDLARRWAEASSPRMVHVSGITAQISSEGRAFLHAVCDDRVFGDALVSFDVNHRPALAGPDTADELLRLARAADIVFVGADEAERLWGVTADRLPELLAGPAHLIVKDGAVEAIEYGRDARTTRPALPVDVVEPVGAGDAFASGWLAAFLDGQGPRNVSTRGIALPLGFSPPRPTPLPPIVRRAPARPRRSETPYEPRRRARRLAGHGDHPERTPRTRRGPVRGGLGHGGARRRGADPDARRRPVAGGSRCRRAAPRIRGRGRECAHPRAVARGEVGRCCVHGRGGHGARGHCARRRAGRVAHPRRRDAE